MRFRDTAANEKSEIGLVTGLAWTEVGGSILSTEVTVVEGKGGKPLLTGKLGDVMQESAQAAITYIRSRWQQLGLYARLLPQYRHSHPCAGGSDSERWPLGWHHHGHRNRQRAQPDPGAARHCHDRRDHASRQGAAASAG